MSEDVVAKYLKCASECNLHCLLNYIKESEPPTGWSPSEKWKTTVSRKLIWRFLENDYFKPITAFKSMPSLKAVLTRTFESSKLSLDDLKTGTFPTNPKALIYRSALLSNLGKLHSNVKRLLSKVDQTNIQHEASTNDLKVKNDFRLLNLMFERNSSNERLREISALNSPSYRQDFLLRFGNAFCQICSYYDTFSDDDFFIFCEVCLLELQCHGA